MGTYVEETPEHDRPVTEAQNVRGRQLPSPTLSGPSTETLVADQRRRRLAYGFRAGTQLQRMRKWTCVWF